MVFVCLSHFAWVHLDLGGASVLAGWLTGVSQVASPAFVILSGILVGYLFQVGSNEAATRARLIDRAVFLLTVGHVVLLVPSVLRSAPGQSPLSWIFLTDAIAVALLATAFLVPRTSAATRVAAGLLVTCLSLTASIFLHPASRWQLELMDGLVGASGADFWSYRTPVLPWLGIFLASTALGERLVERGQRGVSRGLLRTLVALGTGGVVTGLAMRIAYHAVEKSGLMGSSRLVEALDFLSSPWQRSLPSAGYMVSFCGAGLLMIAGVIGLRESGRLPRLTAWLALLGQGSLFVFLFQSWLYHTVMFYFRVPVTPWWPALFLATLGVVTFAAYLWRALAGNRLFTVGLAKVGVDPKPARPAMGRALP